MGEDFQHELDEPSEDLKREFVALVQEHIDEPGGAETFTHSDGRKFTLMLPYDYPGAEEDEVDRCFVVAVEEEIPTDGQKSTHRSISYSLDPVTNKFTKNDDNTSMFAPRQLTPAEQAALDQVKAKHRDRQQDLESKGWKNGLATTAATREMSREIREIPVIAQAMARGLLEHLEARETEEAFGLDRVSGIEVQSILDDVRIAINNPSTT